jgi:hypothetical protein
LFLNGNITEFPCSIEEREVTEIEQ